MSRLVLLLTTLFLLQAFSCKKKKQNTDDQTGSTTSASNSSDSDRTLQIQKSGFEWFELIANKAFNFQVLVGSVYGDLSLSGSFEYNGGSFPGTNGSCSIRDGSSECLLDLVYLSTGVGPKNLTLSLTDDRGTMSTELESESYFLHGQSNWNGPEFFETQASFLGHIRVFGDRMLIPDTLNHRVFLWNSVPSETTKPDLVIGQDNAYSTTPNDGGVTAKTLSTPHDALIVADKLVVADSRNQRVLIWNSIPTQSGQPADVVLGQNNFTEIVDYSASSSSFAYPVALASNGTNLVVADTEGHRVLVWNTIPTVNNQAADLVLGQPDFTSDLQNNNGSGVSSMNATSLHSPFGLLMEGSRLFVSDNNNNRILVWDTFPSINGQAASHVIGQSDFATSAANMTGSANVNAQSLYGPFSMAYNSGKLYVTDRYNYRVLRYDYAVSSDTPTAELVLGQNNMTSRVINNGGLSAKSTDQIRGITIHGNKLYVGDYSNARMMRWDLIGIANFDDAEQVYYKQSFTSGNSTYVAPSKNSVHRPFSISINESKVVVSDTYNQRVLLWSNVTAFLNNQDPSLLLGQSVYTENVLYTDSISGENFQTPQHAHIFSGRLYLSDRNRNRVLVWNSIPTSTVSADFAYGQPDLMTISSGLSANELSQSSDMCVYNGKFVISDKLNDRVLIYNAAPSSNTTNADIVLGAVDKVTPAPGSVSANTLSRPHSVVCAPNGKLVVSDFGNNRLMIWNTFPSADYQAADVVIGQEDFSSAGVRSEFPSARAFGGVTGLAYSNGRLFLADFNANRILYWDAIPTVNDKTADGVIGQDNFQEVSSGFGPGQFQEPLGMAVHNGVIYVVDSRNNRIVGVKIPE